MPGADAGCRKFHAAFILSALPCSYYSSFPIYVNSTYPIMSTQPSHRKVFFPNLDGLRTLACLAVFGFHGFLTIVPQHSGSMRWFALFGSGHMGVNFFFVLSGFLITYLLLEENQQNQRIDLLGFYRRRVVRIWPLFYVCIIYGFLVLPFFMRLLHLPFHETASPWLHVFFLGNLDSVWKNVQPTASSLAVLWSVAIEEQFYLVWPVLLLLLFRRWQLGAFLVVISISVFFRYTHGHNDFLLYRHSLAVMSDMALGGAAAWASFYFPAFRQHIAGWSRWTIAGLYLAGLALWIMEKRLPDTAVVAATQRLMRSAIFVLIILEQNYATNSWFKIKNARWLTYWGTYTYGLYCLHPIVLEGLMYGSDYLRLAPSALNTVLRVFISLPLSAGLAWLSYTYWEKPFLRLKTRRQLTPVATYPASPHSEPAPTPPQQQTEPALAAH